MANPLERLGRLQRQLVNIQGILRELPAIRRGPEYAIEEERRKPLKDLTLSIYPLKTRDPLRIPFLFSLRLPEKTIRSRKRPSQFIPDTSKVTEIPDLYLLVPPASFEISFNKIINRRSTRNAWVEEHWGDDLDEISASGSTGTFITIDPDTKRGGVTTSRRRDSFAYKNFKDLLELYRRNGIAYDQTGAVTSGSFGGVVLSYDYGVFEGYFTNFTYTERDTMPFRFELDWTFRVQRTRYQLFVPRRTIFAERRTWFG